MDIKLLGTHNTESRDTRLVSLLIDGVLAIDAGALTSSLSFEDQLKLKFSNAPCIIYSPVSMVDVLFWRILK